MTTWPVEVLGDGRRRHVAEVMAGLDRGSRSSHRESDVGTVWVSVDNRYIGTIVGVWWGDGDRRDRHIVGYHRCWVGTVSVTSWVIAGVGRERGEGGGGPSCRGLSRGLDEGSVRHLRALSRGLVGGGVEGGEGVVTSWTVEGICRGLTTDRNNDPNIGPYRMGWPGDGTRHVVD